MILLTQELRDRLLANGRLRDVDHVPVVKFFNPVGAATWLATELDEDGETLHGLADLGFGCPEIGAFNLIEMASVRLPFGLGIERDLYFEGAFPLSVYTEAASKAGRIVLDERRLREAVAALRGRG
jgi:hypothetical protein